MPKTPELHAAFLPKIDFSQTFLNHRPDYEKNADLTVRAVLRCFHFCTATYVYARLGYLRHRLAALAIALH